jgi:hypothetical protein
MAKNSGIGKLDNVKSLQGTFYFIFKKANTDRWGQGF